ncbi:unnamed protein product, partial [Chrysoparadoxa australica]
MRAQDLADVPDLMKACRSAALLGSYEHALRHHSDARAVVTRFMDGTGPKEEARKARWRGVLAEMDAEVELVKALTQELTAVAGTRLPLKDDASTQPDFDGRNGRDPDVWPPPTPDPNGCNPRKLPVWAQQRGNSPPVQSLHGRHQGQSQLGAPQRGQLVQGRQREMQQHQPQQGFRGVGRGYKDDQRLGAMRRDSRDAPMPRRR